MMRIATVLLFILFLCSPSFAGGEPVVLTSLEWPPYTGKGIPDNGATASVVRAAFKAVGYEVEFRFLPWNRARDAALADPDVMGYFPEYPSKEREREFLFSDSVGKSPIGMAMRTGKNLIWNTYSDLAKYRIGTVSGYVNDERFDELAEKGVIKVDRSASDALNLRKVEAGHVDLAVVDVAVFEFLMSNDPWLSLRKGELDIVPRMLAIHNLHVCFRPGPEGEKLRDLFNRGLSAIYPMTIQREYMESINIKPQ